jgi:outer membrane protein OmpA-like peptidoglycan-associated protein
LKKKLSSDYSLYIIPRFEKDGKEGASAKVQLYELPGIAMEGTRSRISHSRKVRAGTFHETIMEPLTYIYPQDTYIYNASIPRKEWIDGVSVVVYSTLKTYSGITGQAVFRFGNNLALTLRAEEEPVKQPVNEQPVAAQPFIEHTTDLNRSIVTGVATIKEVEQYIETNGEGSLNVYFEASSSRIDLGLMDNKEALTKLLEAVREIKNNKSVKTRIVVVGYASPEGNTEKNQRLASERARAVQKYVASNSIIGADDIITYDGGINWLGLKRLVMADTLIPKRNDVLKILNEPIWNSQAQTGRLSSLMRLNGGDSYRYMLSNHFPQLRGAAFIKVFIE